MQRTPCSREVRERVGRVGPDLLLEHDERRRVEAAGQLLAGERRVGARRGAAPAGPAPRAASASRATGSSAACRPTPSRARRAPRCRGRRSVAALHFRADENGIDAVRVQPVGAGNASHSAFIVALRFVVGRERAERVGDRVVVGVERSMHRRTRSTPSVSVPVLSSSTTSTRASPSTAGSSCTSTCRRASVTAATRERQAREQHEPFGDHRDDAGDHARDRLARCRAARGTG